MQSSLHVLQKAKHISKSYDAYEPATSCCRQNQCTTHRNARYAMYPNSKAQALLQKVDRPCFHINVRTGRKLVQQQQHRCCSSRLGCLPRHQLLQANWKLPAVATNCFNTWSAKHVNMIGTSMCRGENTHPRQTFHMTCHSIATKGATA